MKTIILIGSILLCSLFSSLAISTNAKTVISEVKTFSPSFSFIRGHKQGRNIAVTWGMTNNSGVNHFIVECTYEDPTDPYSVWQTIGLVPCTNHPIFKFIDAPVLPGTINYRIVAVMNNNTTITSVYYTTYVRG